MQPIFFQKAGKIRLNKYVDGKPVTSPETTFTRAGVVQSIQPNITINGTPIPDGNSLGMLLTLRDTASKVMLL